MSTTPFHAALCDDAIEHMLSFLGFSDRVRFSSTCKTENERRKALCKKHGGRFAGLASPDAAIVAMSMGTIMNRGTLTAILKNCNNSRLGAELKSTARFLRMCFEQVDNTNVHLQICSAFVLRAPYYLLTNELFPELLRSHDSVCCPDGMKRWRGERFETTFSGDRRDNRSFFCLHYTIAAAISKRDPEALPKYCMFHSIFVANRAESAVEEANRRYRLDEAKRSVDSQYLAVADRIATGDNPMGIFIDERVMPFVPFLLQAKEIHDFK
jgi:hypothetical protein